MRPARLVRLDLLALGDRGNGIEPGLLAVHLGDGHVPIERHDRRGFEAEQCVVGREDSRPVRRGVIGRDAVQCRDSGLQMKLGQFASRMDQRGHVEFRVTRSW